MTLYVLNEIRYSQYYPDSGLDSTCNNYCTFDFKTCMGSDRDTGYYHDSLHSVHRVKAIDQIRDNINTVSIKLNQRGSYIALSTENK